MLAPDVQVEIWSDVACPWCYVGKRRFDDAVARFDGEIDVTFRAFELDPSVPTDGLPLDDYLRRKFGGGPRVTRVQERLAALGSELGIDFRWEGKQRVNTFAAHRLLAWALDEAGPDAQRRLKERLMGAYFTENPDLGDPTVLANLAEETGLDRGLATEVLATDQYDAQVRGDEAA